MFVYLFLIYTPVMFIKTAFIKEGINIIVTIKNILNLLKRYLWWYISCKPVFRAYIKLH